MADITIKRGDTLELSIAYSQSGTPIDVSSWTIASQLRKNGKLLTDLTVADDSYVGGTFFLSALPAVTALLPIGVVQCDIQTTVGATVTSTNTFEINVVEDVTSV